MKRNWWRVLGIACIGAAMWFFYKAEQVDQQWGQQNKLQRESLRKTQDLYYQRYNYTDLYLLLNAFGFFYICYGLGRSSSSWKVPIRRITLLVVSVLRCWNSIPRDAA